jgi:hypothetical protein
MRFCYFISYYDRENIPKVLKSRYSAANRDWVVDRTRSYETGTHPFTFPSGTYVSLYSKSHLMYHPDVLDDFVGRFTTRHEKHTYGAGSKKSGRSVAIPVDYPIKNYTPPTLSDIGKSLL